MLSCLLVSGVFMIRFLTRRFLTNLFLKIKYIYVQWVDVAIFYNINMLSHLIEQDEIGIEIHKKEMFYFYYFF